MKTLEERFWSKVDRSGDCWIWTAAISDNGYGRFGNEYAHRVSWRLAGNELPSRKESRMSLDHLCRNRKCVNPAHMQLVTQQENILRGLLGGMRTQCRQGHPYPEFERRRRNGQRYCIACNRENDRKRGWRRRHAMS